MTDLSDADHLARRYLDLWQDQMAAWANDPAVAEVMARGYVMMKRGMVAYADVLSKVTEAAANPMGPTDTVPTDAGPTETGRTDIRTTQHGTRGAASASNPEGPRTGSGRRAAVGGDSAVTADAAHGTSSVALSSDGAGNGAIDIEVRVAALEERIRILESSLGDRSRSDTA